MRKSIPFRKKHDYYYLGIAIPKKLDRVIKRLAKKEKLRKCAMIRELLIEAVAHRAMNNVK